MINHLCWAAASRASQSFTRISFCFEVAGGRSIISCRWEMVYSVQIATRLPNQHGSVEKLKQRSMQGSCYRSIQRPSNAKVQRIKALEDLSRRLGLCSPATFVRTAVAFLPNLAEQPRSLFCLKSRSFVAKVWRWNS